MLTILFILLCLGTNTHAGFIKSDINVTEELNIIENTVLTSNDIKLMSGMVFKPIVVFGFLIKLSEESVTTIGLEELRSALRLSTSPPWKLYNKTEPSEHELATTTTIGDYYNLREPRSESRSLYSPFFYKENIDTAIVFLDKRVPSIRSIFKKKFEKVPVVMDKTTVDNMIGVFNTTDSEVRKACMTMLGKSIFLPVLKQFMANNALVPGEQTPLPQLPSKIEKPEMDMF